ncbi:hypothetical protein [Mycolicibacterium tusciae]|uniref:hypothetical protein n=1 Tax=Mycolicibacterium tusciae TaxID=75922 RepID=UPI0011E53975|nr:hypothetical protein [Mycolicibacterium tusciae]
MEVGPVPYQPMFASRGEADADPGQGDYPQASAPTAGQQIGGPAGAYPQIGSRVGYPQIGEVAAPSAAAGSGGLAAAVGQARYRGHGPSPPSRPSLRWL